jgi:hypothetical protein
MNSSIVDNLSLSNFIKQNKARLYENGRKNVKLNENGNPTISRDDSWFNEDQWDKHFQDKSNK